MKLSGLQHVIKAAQALAEGCGIIVLGSASLLASYPFLGDENGLLVSTFDADILPDPFDELTAVMLDEALGDGRAFYQVHGYHADVLRDSIRETLPRDWHHRLIPVPGLDNAFALEPHDLAAVKTLVARSKDLELIRQLLKLSLIHLELIEQRIRLLPLPVEALPRVLSNFRSLT